MGSLKEGGRGNGRHVIADTNSPGPMETNRGGEIVFCRKSQACLCPYPRHNARIYAPCHAAVGEIKRQKGLKKKEFSLCKSNKRAEEGQLG